MMMPINMLTKQLLGGKIERNVSDAWTLSRLC